MANDRIFLPVKKLYIANLAPEQLHFSLEVILVYIDLIMKCLPFARLAP